MTIIARRAGSDGSMSASGSAGPGFDPWRGSKFSFEICGRGKREKPREKPTQTPFRPPRNPHGATETRTRDTSGGRRAPNRLCHEAASKTGKLTRAVTDVVILCVKVMLLEKCYVRNVHKVPCISDVNNKAVEQNSQ